MNLFRLPVAEVSKEVNSSEASELPCGQSRRLSLRTEKRRTTTMTWKDIAAELTKDFMAFGCRFSRKRLPEIAMAYDCTPLFFWNWMDDPETPKTETGFLRVLGYAWKKYLENESEPGEHLRAASGGNSVRGEVAGESRKAA